MTSKPILLIPVLEQVESLYELLKSINPANWSQVICLYDSSGWDYVEIMKQHFPWAGGIYNTAKPFGFSKIVNYALKNLESKDDVFILGQHCKVPEDFGIIYSTEGIVDFGKEFEEYSLKPLSCSLISRSVFEYIGYLDEVFINSGSSEDFRIRAKAAGFAVGVKNTGELQPQRVDSPRLTDFAALQLNYKYGFRDLTPEQIFSKITEFKEGMIEK